MRRSLLLAAALGAVLLCPAAAMAKGPSVASVSGPGLQHAVSIEGYGEGGNDTALGILVSDGGFFAQAYERRRSQRRRAPPEHSARVTR